MLEKQSFKEALENMGDASSTPLQFENTQTSLVARLARVMMRNRGNPDQNTWGGAVFLVGAGCSASAGIPTGWNIATRKLIELSGAGAQTGEDAIEILKAKDPAHFRSLDKGNAYTWLFENEFKDPVEQRKIIAEALGPDRKINWAHICLGELVKQRFVHTVLTTNFDLLVLDGLFRVGIIPSVADGIEALTRISSAPDHPQVVHLHGSRHNYILRNSQTDVSELESHKTVYTKLSELLSGATAFVVVGYAGGEEAIMKILTQAANGLGGRKEFFWIRRSRSEQLSPRLSELSKSANITFVDEQDADEFFYVLCQELKIEIPEWLRSPTSHLQSEVKQVIKPIIEPGETRQKKHDIRDEIGNYSDLISHLKITEGQKSHEKKILETLRRYKMSGKSEDTIELIRKEAPLNLTSTLLWKKYAEILMGSYSRAVRDELINVIQHMESITNEADCDFGHYATLLAMAQLTASKKSPGEYEEVLEKIFAGLVRNKFDPIKFARSMTKLCSVVADKCFQLEMEAAYKKYIGEALKYSRELPLDDFENRSIKISALTDYAIRLEQPNIEMDALNKEIMELFSDAEVLGKNKVEYLRFKMSYMFHLFSEKRADEIPLAISELHRIAMERPHQNEQKNDAFVAITSLLYKTLSPDPSVEDSYLAAVASIKQKLASEEKPPKALVDLVTALDGANEDFREELSVSKEAKKSEGKKQKKSKTSQNKKRKKKI